MKYFLLFIIPAFLIGCIRHKPQSSCGFLSASFIKIDSALRCPQGKVLMLSRAVHDTLAVDLLLHVKELETGDPIAKATVTIEKIISTKTDGEGRASFIAFAPTSGTFNVQVSQPDYECLNINALHFGSGDIFWLDVYLRKKHQ